MLGTNPSEPLRAPPKSNHVGRFYDLLPREKVLNDHRITVQFLLNPSDDAAQTSPPPSTPEYVSGGGSNSSWDASTPHSIPSPTSSDDSRYSNYVYQQEHTTCSSVSQLPRHSVLLTASISRPSSVQGIRPNSVRKPSKSITPGGLTGVGLVSRHSLTKPIVYSLLDAYFGLSSIPQDPLLLGSTCLTIPRSTPRPIDHLHGLCHNVANSAVVPHPTKLFCTSTASYRIHAMAEPLIPVQNPRIAYHLRDSHRCAHGHC